MTKLAQKNVLITGAASGIGRLMALSFADEKSNVALVDLNSKDLDKVVKELSDRDIKAEAYQCDISDEEMVKKVVKNIKKDFGTVDVLVNNAGIVNGKSFMELSMKEIHKTMDVNFFGHVIFTKLLIEDMIARDEGHIVNIASSAGLLGFPKASDYNASKFAEVGFTEALRMELHKFGYKGVKTTLVCPYVIDTGMFEGFKPLFLNPILKPDYVVKKIIKGVRKNTKMLKIPFMVNLTLLMKVFPPSVSDWAFRVMGIAKAMDAHSGHGVKK